MKIMILKILSPSKNQRKLLTLKNNFQSILRVLKLSIKLRCVETMSLLEIAFSRIVVHLPMDLMNFIKDLISLKTIKLDCVRDSMKKCTAPMDLDANSNILRERNSKQSRKLANRRLIKRRRKKV